MITKREWRFNGVVYLGGQRYTTTKRSGAIRFGDLVKSQPASKRKG